MIDFTIRQLRYAIALSEIGHFGRAAEACHVSQPALSQQIRQIEAICGGLLFERRGGGVHPTPFGREFIAQARRVIGEADTLVGFAAQHSGEPKRAISFGLIPTIAPYLLPEIYPSLVAELPEARFIISEAHTVRLLEGLESGAIDIALIATEPPEDARLRVAPLFADPFVLATARRRSIVEPVALKALSPGEILLLEEGHCFRDQAIDACALSKTETATSFAATSLSTIVEFVANDQGVTLLPAISLKKEAGDARIAIHALAPPGASRLLRLAWRRNSPFDGFFAQIADIVQIEGQKVLAEAV